MNGAHAGELQDDAPRSEGAVYEAPAVLRLLWADPQYMPEHLAVWSLKYFGPRAESAVAKLRESHPGADLGELEAAVIKHQTRVSMTEGAFVGGPLHRPAPGRVLRGDARPGTDGTRVGCACRLRPG
jgi:hypothetical protein